MIDGLFLTDGMVHERLVSWQGGVVRNREAEWRQSFEAKIAREGEPFTASVDCPDCGVMDIHWIEEPRLPDELDEGTPVARAFARINAMGDMLAALQGQRPYYDLPGTTVARICKSCDYRWGQT